MRPPGEIRRAVLQAAWAVAVEKAMDPVPGATWRDVAARLVPHQIAPRAVHYTWKNLARSGELRQVGPVRVPGSARQLVACVPAMLGAPVERAGQGLEPAVALALRAMVGQP